MVTSKFILNNLKNKDTSSLFVDLKVFLSTTDGGCQALDVLSIFKAVCRLMNNDPYTESSKILHLVPSVSLCVEYFKSHFIIEDSLIHELLVISAYVIQIYFKFELPSPALLYATDLKFILEKHLSATNKDKLHHDAIVQIGKSLYSSEHYHESTYFLETGLKDDALSDGTVEEKFQNFKGRQVLAYAYSLSGNYKMSLQTAVKLLLNHNDNRNVCLELWYRMKRNAFRKEDNSITSSIISDVLKDIKAQISKEEEISWLLQELRGCKLGRYSHKEEALNIIKRLMSLQCNGLNLANVMLETISMGQSVTETISSLLKKSPLSMCEESITLFKEYVDQNPTNNEVKLQLSISYVWLFFLKLQLLHKQPKDAVDSEQPKSEDEENESEMMPTTSLLTFQVEAETFKSLEMALEVWSDIFNTSKNSGELAELDKNWDMLTYIKVAAEYFSLSVHDINELRSLVLLLNIASAIGSKLHEFNSFISLINFLVRMGYLKMASQFLKVAEKSRLNSDCITNLEKLKLQVAKSNLYLHEGKFDEGMSLLRKIFEDLMVMKSHKSVFMLHTQSLMLLSKFLLLPPSAFTDTQNIDYFNDHNAISSAKSSADKARCYFENKKQRNESSNDRIFNRAQMQYIYLSAILQLGEHFIRIGDPRHAKCFLLEGLDFAEQYILTYWSSKFLILLGQIDLQCQDLNNCMVKLNTLQYIMDENYNENTSMLLSKAFSNIEVPESRDISESFILPSETLVPLKRSIQQNFINNADVHSSPISNKKETNLKFEVKSSTLFDNMFSVYIIKLEIWALSCLHLIAENKVQLAETQFKKLLKKCEMLKHTNEKVSIVFKTFNKDLPVLTKEALNRNPTISETMLLVLALLKLSLLYFAKEDFKNTKHYIDSAFKALSESSEHEKYLHSNMYGLLKYHETVISLKNILGIKHESCLEVSVCPFVEAEIISTSNVLKESSINVETPKKDNASRILNTRSKKRLCKAPLKKDVLPIHIKRDIRALSNLNRLPSVVFSSSEDDFMSPVISPKQGKNTVSSSTEIKGGLRKEKKSYTIFKSKNSDVEIYTDVSTPIKRKPEKSKPYQIEPISLRKTRQNKQRVKSDSNSSSKLLNVPSGKQARKLHSNSKSLKCSDKENTLESISPHDEHEERTVSIGHYRSTSKTPQEQNIFESAALEDVFYPNSTGVVSNTEKYSTTPGITIKSPCIETLCNDLNDMNLLENTNRLKDLTIPDENLMEFIDELDQIRLLIQHNAQYPLYVDLCKLLAVLKMCKNPSFSKPHDFAFLLSETFSSVLRELCLSNHLKEKASVDDKSYEFSRLLKRKDTCIINQMECLYKVIPDNYTVVQITPLFEQEHKSNSVTNHAVSKLIICRYQQNCEPLVVCLKASSSKTLTSSIFDEFNKILLESTSIMKKSPDGTSAPLKVWWKTRLDLDERLKNLVKDIEDAWLGCWKGLLLSSASDEKRVKLLREMRDSICKVSEPSNKKLLEVLLDSASVLTYSQISAAVCHLWKCNSSDESYSLIFNSVLEAKVKLPDSKRNPLVLILDKDIQALPWESLSILSNVPVSRMPSLSIMISKLAMPDTKYILQKGMDSTNTFYIVDPAGDIEDDQKYFRPQFERQASWKGIVGKTPSPEDSVSALENHDLFVYVGHGSGKQYIKRTAINKLSCRATALLMGCSSGCLKQDGKQLEGNGIPLTYLVKGCPCVVGNLWDVTNKDMNKFTEKMLELLVPNYKEEQATTDVATAVAEARSACRLRYLNGSAPVVYGFPIFARM